MLNFNSIVIGVLLCLCIALNESGYTQTRSNTFYASAPPANLTQVDTSCLDSASVPIVIPPQIALARWLIHFYKIMASPAKGTVCPMYPTCSQYASEAFTQHNPLRAWLMTSDRLMRCGMDQEQYPKVLIGERYRWLDGDSGVFKNSLADMLSQNSNLKVYAKGIKITSVTGHQVVPDREPCSDSDSAMYHFAEWLKKRGNYGPAITEYLRLEYYHPLSSYIFHVRKSICECYYLLGSYKEAIDYGESLVDSAMPLQDKDNLLLVMGASHFRSGSYDKAIETFGRILHGEYPDDSESYTKALILQGLSAANLRKWKDAKRQFLEVPDHSKYKHQALYCAYLCSEIYSSKRKSPSLAGTLAIIPGLGYLYDGYPRTALSAFIINGVFIWGAAEAFQDNHDGLGATLSVIGFGWYAGNIYGSVTSAKRSNEKHERDLLLKLDIGFEF
jgi:putative component of membrane protein insertase Oxa1/YidC/SpoIIIJ protein YidD/TolA-binding protein